MRAPFLLLLGLSTGCLDILLGTEEPTPTAPTETTPTVTTPEPTTPPKPAEPDRAGDIDMTKVSIYQGVERVLWEDRAPPFGVATPVIVNREGLLRIFVSPRADFEARRVNAIVTLSGGNEKDVVLESAMRITGPSTDGDPDSTFNFTIAAADLRIPTEISVELREINTSAPGGGRRPATTFDSVSDLAGGLPTAQGEDITVVILPIRYNADGSGRLPDTSALHVSEIRDLFYATYPVNSVEMVVAGPSDWPNPIQADGSGFVDLLYAVTDARQANAPDELPNTYYYAMFNPAADFGSFCGYICTVGLSNLALDPNQPGLRSSVGVGYRDYGIARNTLIHEVGHAHGRFHADCGGPAYPDVNYPYLNGSIGSWGYDITTQTLYDPAVYTDMMGYCNDVWVSDYTFDALWARLDLVSGLRRSMPRLVSQFLVDGEGRTGDLDLIRVLGPTVMGGLPLSVALFDETGEEQDVVTGWLYPYSHLPGGRVSLDEALPEGWAVEIR